MSSSYHLHQYSADQIIAALLRIEAEYPAVFTHFFLSELRKENFVLLSEEDAIKLGFKVAPAGNNET